ncbi:MAG: hypothetical protein IIA87_05280 [Nanoarchaeota archaeon]|nr:hypothetical protein [Nanoarchaeota archaeon]
MNQVERERLGQLELHYQGEDPLVLQFPGRDAHYAFARAIDSYGRFLNNGVKGDPSYSQSSRWLKKLTNRSINEGIGMSRDLSSEENLGLLGIIVPEKRFFGYVDLSGILKDKGPHSKFFDRGCSNIAGDPVRHDVIHYPEFDELRKGVANLAGHRKLRKIVMLLIS